MPYLLDTNAISDLMKGDPVIKTWMAGLGDADRVFTCTIARGEILFGIARLPIGRRRAELAAIGFPLLATIPCEAVPERASDFYAIIKATRQQLGLALDENDLWIAATAMTLGATLVSRDGDFAGIDGLHVIDLKR